MRVLRLLVLPLAFTAAAFAAEPTPEADTVALQRIYDAALTASPAYDHLNELVTNFPGRLSGSKTLEGAVLWAKATLEKQGVDRLELQPVMVPHWERGAAESVYLVPSGPAEVPSRLNALALGGSVPTTANSPLGLKAGVVEIHSLDELKTTDVKGKIVFFNRPMRPQDVMPDTAYGGVNDQRNQGPGEAAKYGAVGALTRSLTHVIDDVPHTGNTVYVDGAPRLPAAALSTIAANQLSAALKADPTLQVAMQINSQWFAPAPSYNIIGEIRGSEFPDQVILVGGHIDAWDITPGAHDDGAGVVQSIDVLRILQAIGYHPRHTIRCVLFVSEENSGNGSAEYARIAGAKKEKHLLALESDLGGFQPHRFQLGNLAGDAHLRAARWRTLFEPYSIALFSAGDGGADVEPLKRLGGVTGEILSDTQLYFNYHHTRIDSLDKVNPRELQLGAAAMAALAYLFDQHEL